MKRLSLIFVLLGCLLSSCSNLSEKEIEETTASGVVLVQNRSYYEVVLSNGVSLFFSGFDEKGDLKGIAAEEDSVEAVTGYGTGFFISETGEMATNAHVVSNMVSDKAVNKSVANILAALKKMIAVVYNEYNRKLQQAQMLYDYAYANVYANDYSAVSYEEFERVKQLRDAIHEEMQQYAQIYNGLDEIRASDSEIKYHNKVSIAYNNTFVTGPSDFVSCVVTKTDAEHDLAVIQLKDKKTPTGKYIFQVEDEDPLETYSWKDDIETKIKDDKNSKFFMSSFNLGPQLAFTKEGIKSQFNSGSVSQKTGERLMYSIPALPGSSGSPVVNLQGQLVAINYAGLNGTQNFNYGIRVKYLKELMKK